MTTIQIILPLLPLLPLPPLLPLLPLPPLLTQRLDIFLFGSPLKGVSVAVRSPVLEPIVSINEKTPFLSF